MMAFNRRRRYGEPKKVTSVISVRAALTSLLSGGLLAALLAYSVFTEGNNAKWVVGIAFLSMVMAFVSLGYGIKEFKNNTYSEISRYMGLLLPLLASAAWILIYIVGMVV